MPFYMITGKYTKDGADELVHGTATALDGRLARAAESLGGRLLRLYFMGAGHDLIALFDISGPALLILLNSMVASGAFVFGGVEAARYLSAQEADQAVETANRLSQPL